MANHKKQRNKLKPEEVEKITNRFRTKFDEFTKLSLNELKDTFNNTKMSSTDRDALIKATSVVMRMMAEDTLTQSKEDGKEKEIGIGSDEQGVPADANKDNK